MSEPTTVEVTTTRTPGVISLAEIADRLAAVSTQPATAAFAAVADHTAAAPRIANAQRLAGELAAELRAIDQLAKGNSAT